LIEIEIVIEGRTPISILIPIAMAISMGFAKK